MSKGIPGVVTGGDSGDRKKQLGGAIGLGFGMPPAAISSMDKFNNKWNGGESPKFLSPKNYFNGDIKNELTGDQGTDMRHGLAKYGLFAAPWAPALYNESRNKGRDISAKNEREAHYQQQMDEFNSIQPYQRDVPYSGGGSYQGGAYNDAAEQLTQQAQMGGQPQAPQQQPQAPQQQPQFQPPAQQPMAQLMGNQGGMLDSQITPMQGNAGPYGEIAAGTNTLQMPQGNTGPYGGIAAGKNTNPQMAQLLEILKMQQGNKGGMGGLL